MADIRSIKDFEDQIDALEIALDGAGTMTVEFGAELKQMQSTFADLSGDVGLLSSGISRGLRKAFDGLIFDGMKLSDAMKTVALSMADAAYNAALKPVTDHFGGILGSLVGGVMNGAMPLGGGPAGAVAPAGAISPMGRSADAGQGLAGGGQGRPVNLTLNITTPDVEGFRRSQSQIAAQMGRALARGQRHR